MGSIVRTDILLLSSETKPSDMVDGSTAYIVDTGDFYIYYKGTWYKQGASDEESNEESEGESNDEQR